MILNFICTCAYRFNVKDVNANPLFVLNTDSPGPSNYEMMWRKHCGKDKVTKKSRVNLKEVYVVEI